MAQKFDSPSKPSSASITASAKGTLAKDVIKAVKQDLDHAIVLTHNDKFLDDLLGKVDQPTEGVISGIVKNFFDKKTKRWKGFPETGKKNKFYTPFVNLANQIAKEIHCALGEDVEGRWVDCHVTTLTANAEFVAEIRPDCAFISNPHVHSRHKYNIRKRSYDDLANPRPQKKFLKPWWCSIEVAVEIKPPKIDDQKAQYPGALPQLIMYIRQILRQQLDRRFIFGITISFRDIAVWLCDRSGVLETSHIYNFNENPEVLVRIISALSTLSRYRAGWDPTMKLYNKYDEIFRFSYQHNWTNEQRPPTLDQSEWSLLVVDNWEKGEKKVRIILDGPSLLIRMSEIMNGRAVRVHRGYAAEDKDKAVRMPLVVKSSWQPVAKLKGNQTPEVYFYSLVPAFQERVLAGSVMKANHGWADGDIDQDYGTDMVSTMGYIRKSAQADFNMSKKWNETIKKLVSGGGKGLEESKECTALMGYGLSTTSEHHIYFAEDDSMLTDRVQTTFFLNVWGWTVMHCLNPKELLGAVMGAIEDHLKMYKKGVLHRDVSPANILIRPGSPTLDMDVLGLTTAIRGMLIDLDHAKSTTDFKTISSSCSQELIKRTAMIAKIEGDSIAEDAVVQVSKLKENAIEAILYFREAKKLNVMGAAPEGKWTAKDLGWDKDVGKIPDFASHVPNVAERTGTIPYISHKLLHGRVAHDAIHDLESLWWTLVYICLTRQSGGAEQQWTDPSKERDKLITSLFYAGTYAICGAKKFHFGSSDVEGMEEFKESSKHFHPYFKDFKPMLEKWRSVLYLGYKFKAYEYYLIHRYVLHIIRQTYNRLPDGDNGTPEAYQREIQRRIKEYSALCLPQSTVNANPVANPQVPSSLLSVPPAGISPFNGVTQTQTRAISMMNLANPDPDPSALHPHTKKQRTE